MHQLPGHFTASGHGSHVNVNLPRGCGKEINFRGFANISVPSHSPLAETMSGRQHVAVVEQRAATIVWFLALQISQSAR